MHLVRSARLAAPALACGLAVLAALCPATGAQSAPQPAGPGDTAPKPVDRSALQVTGLTHLNAGVVTIALEGIAHRSWHCVECNVTQAEERPCPACAGAMIAVEQTLLCAVEVDPDAGTIRFDVLPGLQVRLTEIQAAVARYKVVIPPDRQYIPHVAKLLVAGPTSKEQVAQLVEALAASKLFEKVSGSYDEAGKQAELSVRCVGAPARPQVAAALARSGEGYRLADIVWAAGAGAGQGRG